MSYPEVTRDGKKVDWIKQSEPTVDETSQKKEPFFYSIMPEMNSKTGTYEIIVSFSRWTTGKATLVQSGSRPIYKSRPAAIELATTALTGFLSAEDPYGREGGSGRTDQLMLQCRQKN